MKVEYIYKPAIESKGWWQPNIEGNILKNILIHYNNKEIELPDFDLSELQEGDKLFIDVANKQLVLADNFTSIVYEVEQNIKQFIGPFITVRNGIIFVIKHLPII